MRIRHLLGAVAVAALVFAPASRVMSAEPPALLDHKVKNIDGETVDLKDYAGKVVLIVNTASACGCTPQYKPLEELYRTYKDKGFVILAFPCNDFGGQEPGSESEIKDFCSSKYAVSFPLFAKVKIRGKDKHPLYAQLTSKETNPDFGGDVSWNFTKFLIGRDGKVVARFEPRDEPDTPEFVKAIEAALAAKS